jgi:cobalt-precorrin 5A hydrolase / precorrin-3B C17-methyltransferase
MTALVVLTQQGAALARRIVAAVPGAEIHGLDRRVTACDVIFSDTLAHLRDLFTTGRPIVAVCASGIVIRALALALNHKTREPPVVAVAEDGSAVVPLLGGHRGANDLARQIAATLGITAAITTAGDVSLGFALDQPPSGWRIANPEAIKDLAATLLAGNPVHLDVQAGTAEWLTAIQPSPKSVRTIVVTDRQISGDAHTLVYHPPVLALGVGSERGVAVEELEELARSTMAEHGVSPLAVAGVFSIDLKQDESAIHALAAVLGVPVRFFSAERLKEEEPRLANPSQVVRDTVGVAGVAEAAALAAAGPQATLIVPKTKSARATLAIARSPVPIDVTQAGHPRGHLAIIGIGPGAVGWRTSEAVQALREASDVVGYGLYLDLVADLTAGKALHASALGAEEERARRALELAATGKRVALVSSGDAGIYGLATLVFELVERGGPPDWSRVEIAVCPGLSALQAAAARAGAPLGHDFAVVSLSDLLTPWPTIERRLKATAAVDFVLALYNPASQRRRTQIERAREILLDARSPDTPVVLARNLGRTGEHVEVARLADDWTDRVDMLTLVVIGSSETRRLDAGGRTWVFTPRGYAAKPAAAAK